MPEPFPPIIERSLRSQSLLPLHRRLRESSSDVVSSFQRSAATFQVVCTVRRRLYRASSSLRTIKDNVPSRPIAETLVVLDSSFNPPTVAHLEMATEAVRDLWKGEDQERLQGREGGERGWGCFGGNCSEQRQRARLLLLLAIKNADKVPKPAAFEQRLAMMCVFAKDVLRKLSAQPMALEEGESNESDPPVEMLFSAGGNHPEEGDILPQRSEGEQTGGQDDHSGDLSVDVALTTEPYFHDKSAAIAQCALYGGKSGGKAEPPYDMPHLDPDKQPQQPKQLILAGYDTLIRIFNPKYYGKAAKDEPITNPGGNENGMRSALAPLFAQARLRVTMRTEDEWGDKEEQVAYVENLLNGDGLEKVGGSREWARRIELVGGGNDGGVIVSSTLARDAAKKKDWATLRQLVSPEVTKWIEMEGLYTE